MPNYVDRYRWLQAVGDHGPPLPLARLILHTLGLHMQSDGTDAFPSQKTIARRACVCRRTVIEHLAAAEKSGWIERGIRGGEGQGWRLSAYRATVPDEVFPLLPEKPWESDPTWQRGASASPRRGASARDARER